LLYQCAGQICGTITTFFLWFRMIRSLLYMPLDWMMYGVCALYFTLLVCRVLGVGMMNRSRSVWRGAVDRLQDRFRLVPAVRVVHCPENRRLLVEHFTSHVLFFEASSCRVCSGGSACHLSIVSWALGRFAARLSGSGGLYLCGRCCTHSCLSLFLLSLCSWVFQNFSELVVGFGLFLSGEFYRCLKSIGCELQRFASRPTCTTSCSVVYLPPSPLSGFRGNLSRNTVSLCVFALGPVGAWCAVYLLLQRIGIGGSSTSCILSCLALTFSASCSLTSASCVSCYLLVLAIFHRPTAQIVKEFVDTTNVRGRSGMRGFDDSSDEGGHLRSATRQRSLAPCGRACRCPLRAGLSARGADTAERNL